MEKRKKTKKKISIRVKNFLRIFFWFFLIFSKMESNSFQSLSSRKTKQINRIRHLVIYFFLCFVLFCLLFNNIQVDSLHFKNNFFLFYFIKCFCSWSSMIMMLIQLLKRKKNGKENFQFTSIQKHTHKRHMKFFFCFFILFFLRI